MKLIYYIILRITLALTLILTVWAIFFYVTMIDEVNDEVDDALEDYSETIIIRALAGEELPSKTNGSNNQYYMMEVSKEYAENREALTASCASTMKLSRSIKPEPGANRQEYF